MESDAPNPEHLRGGLYGIHGSHNKGHTLIDNILRQAEAGEPIRVVEDMFFLEDMFFSPSHSLHVAQAIHRVTEGAPFGTYHVAAAVGVQPSRKSLRLSAVCPRLNTRFVGASSLQR